MSLEDKLDTLHNNFISLKIALAIVLSELA